jgi:hypothetical protein
MLSWNESIRQIYDELKPEIDRGYPTGRFVAIESSRTLTDAGSLQELVEQLKFLGKDPQDVLVVQAGVEHPETATILVNLAGHRHA